jgi:phage shock protein A
MADLSALDAGVIGSLGAAAGAVLTELVRRLFPSRDLVIQDGAALRNELWEHIRRLEKEVRTHREDVDEWQAKYFELQQSHTALQAEVATLRSELVELRNRPTAHAAST